MAVVRQLAISDSDEIVVNIFWPWVSVKFQLTYEHNKCYISKNIAHLEMTKMRHSSGNIMDYQFHNVLT